MGLVKLEKGRDKEAKRLPRDVQKVAKKSKVTHPENPHIAKRSNLKKTLSGVRK
jgi:hypothetical protein